MNIINRRDWDNERDPSSYRSGVLVSGTLLANRALDSQEDLRDNHGILNYELLALVQLPGHFRHGLPDERQGRVTFNIFAATSLSAEGLAYATFNQPGLQLGRGPAPGPTLDEVVVVSGHDLMEIIRLNEVQKRRELGGFTRTREEAEQELALRDAIAQRVYVVKPGKPLSIGTGERDAFAGLIAAATGPDFDSSQIVPGHVEIAAYGTGVAQITDRSARADGQALGSMVVFVRS